MGAPARIFSSKSSLEMTRIAPPDQAHSKSTVMVLSLNLATLFPQITNDALLKQTNMYGQ